MVESIGATINGLNEAYWQSRWADGQTGWDLGKLSNPLKFIIDNLEDQDARILVPGAGNGYEVGYLFDNGFMNTYLLDWAKYPLDHFASQYPDFPKAQLLHRDFFSLADSFDIIIEQTFFCALEPSLRPRYVEHMHNLLKPGGVLTGVLFNHPLFTDYPPFGGNLAEYQDLFQPLFSFDVLEPCDISEPDRQGMELMFRCSKE